MRSSSTATTRLATIKLIHHDEDARSACMRCCAHTHVWGTAALSLDPNPKTLNFPLYKKSRPLVTHKGVYLPLLPGTVGHEERSGGACWPTGFAPLLRWRVVREGLASLLPRPQALSSIKPAVALPAERRRRASERRRSGRRTTSTEACFWPKTTATQLQRCRLFPLHYGVCCPS